jgi:hypothetical protein
MTQTHQLISTRPAALLLCVVTVTAAVPAHAQPATGPLRAASRTDTWRVATNPRPTDQDSSNWHRVSRLSPATEILVEVRGTSVAVRHFVGADDAELVVLDLAGPRLTENVRRILLDIASTHRDVLLKPAPGVRFVQHNVTLASEGVFLGDRKLADVDDVVERLPRTSVVAIMTPPKRRGSLVGAAIGATGGFVLGYASAVRLAYKQCGGSCSDERALMGLSVVGLPIAGALLGYQANPRVTQEIIYREDTGALHSRDR